MRHKQNNQLMDNKRKGAAASPPRHLSEANNNPNPAASATTGDARPEALETNNQRPGRSFVRSMAIEIQEKLGARKPDITAAFVLATVLTWRLNARHRSRKQRVQGALYLSAEQIRQDLPWLSRSAVLRALQRLAKAYPKKIVLHKDKLKVTNISIREGLRSEYWNRHRAEGAISLDPTDAVEHGVLAAILVRNLEWKTTHCTVALRDQHGRAYGEMSPTALTENRSNLLGSFRDELPPILPYSRQEVSAVISELVRKGLFVAHPSRPEFYRVQRELEAVEDQEKCPCCGAATVSANAPEVSANAPRVSANAPSNSLEIESEDGNQDGNSEIESDKEKTVVGPAALPPVLSSSQRNPVNESFPKDSGPVPLDIGPVTGPGSASTHQCLSLDAVFPGSLAEVERRVRRYRELRRNNQLVTAVSNDELHYDRILDPHDALLVELGVPVDSSTGLPIDPADRDWQINNVLENFPGESFKGDPCIVPENDEDLATLRGLFDRYPGLNEAILCELVDHIREASTSPEDHIVLGDRGEHWSNAYFAERVRNVRQFARYFEQLFVERFAPVVEISHTGMRREWDGRCTDGRRYRFSELRRQDFDELDEPFRAIFERARRRDRERKRAEGAAEAAPGANAMPQEVVA